MNVSRNLLISGAAGFLGSRLLPALCDNGYNVTAIVRNEDFCTSYKQIQNINFLIRDIAFTPLTADEACCYDTIIHLAGATEEGDDSQLHFLANEMTTIGLANQHTNSIRKFIYASSQVVYGNPNSRYVDESYPVDPVYSSYATSKINAENWLRVYQSNASNMTLCLRLCGFVDGGGLVDSLIRDALAGKNLELFGFGNVFRDYIHSSIFVDLILRLLRHEPAPIFSVVNVGSGQELSSFQIATLIKEATNSVSQIIRSSTPPRRNDFVYKIDKLLSMTGISLPSLYDQILTHANTSYTDIACGIDK